VEVRDEVGRRSGPFIGAERRFEQRFLSSKSFDGRQWRCGENIMALTSGWQGFGGLGAIGCDASCRFTVEEGRQRRRAAVEVTGRSNGGLHLSGKRGGAATWRTAGPALACRAREAAGQARQRRGGRQPGPAARGGGRGPLGSRAGGGGLDLEAEGRRKGGKEKREKEKREKEKEKRKNEIRKRKIREGK
jgi:hypothetical protein